MNEIFWSDGFITGVKLIDEQHFSFISALLQLYQYDDKVLLSKLYELQNQIYDELKAHFSYEETLMRQHQYFGFYSHKMEHERFLNKFYKYFNSVAFHSPSEAKEFLKSMFHWFQNHLVINDLKLTDYLHSINKNENKI